LIVVGREKGRRPFLVTNEEIERKLDALVADEKLKANRDPIYHVLSDVTWILDAAYRTTGVSRPRAQVRAESLDILVECLSGDHDEVSTERIDRRIAEEVEKYRPLPGTFWEGLANIVAERSEKTKGMTAEERAEEVFAAYMGSINTTEELWRSSRRDDAVRLAKEDRLLDEIIAREGIDVSDEEVTEAYLKLADECAVPVETVKEQLNTLSLAWRLKRDKARELAVAS
jgi:hypothetical protein